MDENIKNTLSNIYYDPQNSASFSSVKSLYDKVREIIPNVKLTDVKNWLSEQLTYTLHKQVRKKFKRNPIIVNNINEQWEADLVDMKEFSNKNDRYNYILT